MLQAALRVGASALLLLPSSCKGSARPAPETRPALVSSNAGGTTIISVPVAALEASATPRLRRDFELACGGLAKTECDISEESCQERLFELAKCVSGRHGARPPVRITSKANSRDRAERPQAGSARAALEGAACVLGLGLGLGKELERQRASEQASSSESGLDARAYYSPRERVVFFVLDDGSDASDERALSTLVHEYVHALQDEDGELLAAQNGSDARTLDQELAAWSAFEGEAVVYEEAVRALRHERDPRSTLLERFAQRASGSDSAIVRQRRPLTASFAMFPYTYGAYWATLETEKPVSTQQIMARRHGFELAGEATSCADESPETLGPGYPRRTRDTLGAWLVQAYVRRHTGDPERARAAVRNWRGDWLSVYTRAPTGAPGIVWQSCWDSAQTALEMRELIAAQLRESSGDTATVTSEGPRVTATARAAERPGTPG
jgi:hypothetical protein